MRELLRHLQRRYREALEHARELHAPHPDDTDSSGSGDADRDRDDDYLRRSGLLDEHDVPRPAAHAPHHADDGSPVAPKRTLLTSLNQLAR